MKYSRFALFVVVAFLAFSCSPALDPNAPLTEVESFQRSFMTSFDMARGTDEGVARAFSPFMQVGAGSRATVPMSGTQSYPLPTTGSLANYPEPGQTSSWVVTLHAGDVYRVEVTTTFPSYDPRLRQEEFYYLKDIDANDTWTTADIVVDDSGNASSTYRIRNRLYFRDGSQQNEVITTVKTAASDDTFKPWLVTASLDYPAFFQPETDTAANYSSVVVYTRTYTDSPDFTFWNGQRAQTLMGIRYYTEKLVGTGISANLVSSMIVFEKAVTQLTTTGGTFADASSSLFLPAVGVNPVQTMLAQSVLRQEVVYDLSGYTSPDSFTVNYASASRDTRMKTQVVNVAGQGDFYIQRINSEAAQLLNADGSLWIPTGNAAEVLAGDPAALVDTKSTNLALSTGDTAPVAVTNDSPVGDLGTLWKAITDGTFTAIGLSDDVPGDLTGEDDYQVFSGSQGITLPAPVPATAYSFHDKGTVQAWVYVVGATNTPGIVHSGAKADWTDEIWSLQFMGSTNTVAFSMSAQTPYKYDYVTSTYNLNLGKWYYLVATWDLTPAQAKNRKMILYINGVSNASKTFSNVSPTSKFAPLAPATSVPVVIGSQFYDATQALSGYYGLNGKINGVLIENRVWTPAEILAFYNANKAKTALW